MAEAVVAWAVVEATGGEAALGEAAAGSWAEAGSSRVVAWLVHTGACSIGVLIRWDQERQQVKGATLHGSGGCSRGRLGGRQHSHRKQSRIFQKAWPQLQRKSPTPHQNPKREGLKPQGGSQ